MRRIPRTPAGRCGSSKTSSAMARGSSRFLKRKCTPPSPARRGRRGRSSTPRCRSTWRDTRAGSRSRVIGQSEAVNLVVDLLATVKAGLTRPNRPIASLLFIGPTGVGKTEMAKALAEFLFGSKRPAHALRHERVRRPGVGAAAGRRGLRQRGVAHRQGPRTAVLRAPARRSRKGRRLVLRSAVAGAGRSTVDRCRRPAGGLPQHRRHPHLEPRGRVLPQGFDRVRGRPANRAEATDHFVRAVEQFLRPEMFNRLDRIVPFAPLDAAHDPQHRRPRMAEGAEPRRRPLP